MTTIDRNEAFIKMTLAVLMTLSSIEAGAIHTRGQALTGLQQAVDSLEVLLTVLGDVTPPVHH
ncbi:hypothetical protein ACYZT7_10275 [Pseudomonas sp. RT4P38]